MTAASAFMIPVLSLLKRKPKERKALLYKLVNLWKPYPIYQIICVDLEKQKIQLQMMKERKGVLKETNTYLWLDANEYVQFITEPKKRAFKTIPMPPGRKTSIDELLKNGKNPIGTKLVFRVCRCKIVGKKDDRVWLAQPIDKHGHIIKEEDPIPLFRDTPFVFFHSDK
jgi:hypothetical protein